jgi:anti-sigma-K factor RskA
MGATFDREWRIKSVSQRIEKNNAMRNDVRAWQNDDSELRKLFAEGVDTRQKLKDLYGVW